MTGATARHLRSVATGGVLLAIVTACGSQAATSSTAAPYAATDLADAGTVTTAALAGKPALLTTWATWCEECRDEMPALEALWEERRDDGLQVVAVNVNATGPSERTIGQMIDGWGLTMPQWRDPENRFTARFGGMGVPMTVLLAADGSVAKVWFGAIDERGDEVRAAIDAVLDA